MPPTTQQATVSPPAEPKGIFKLSPELRNHIYAYVFEDFLNTAESNDAACPCRLEGKCGHTGRHIYKPLAQLRAPLDFIHACKLFHKEAKALLFVDYVPKAGAWCLREGKEGLLQLGSFLSSIREEDVGNMQFCWRLNGLTTLKWYWNWTDSDTDLRRRLWKSVCAIDPIIAELDIDADDGGCSFIQACPEEEHDHTYKIDGETFRYEVLYTCGSRWGKHSFAFRGPLERTEAWTLCERQSPR